jgi:hypothetical protein
MSHLKILEKRIDETLNSNNSGYKMIWILMQEKIK